MTAQHRPHGYRMARDARSVRIRYFAMLAMECAVFVGIVAAVITATSVL